MPKKFIRDARRARAAAAAATADTASEQPANGTTVVTPEPVVVNVPKITKSLTDDPNVVSGTVDIGAGTQFEVPVVAYEGCVLVWSFKTEGGDMGFGVTFKADDSNKPISDPDDDSKKFTNPLVALKPGEEITLSETRRYNSDVYPVQGTVQIARAGTITLKWDNSYSYFKGKTLIYSVELEEPLGLQAGPRSLGGPETPTVVFVLGGPGAGKGTQCTRLAKTFGFLHVSAGDLLRAERNDPESQHGQLISNYIKEGKIVPVEITVALLWKAIRESGRRFILVDGFPRNRDNLEGWQRKVGGRAQIACCLSFEVPDDILVNRLLERGKNSGRDDDNIETIKKRLATFHEETKPIAGYFEKRNELVVIDGNRPQDVVFENVCNELKLRLKSNLPPHDDYVLAAPRNRIPPRVILGTMNIGGEGMREEAAKEYLREFSMAEPGCDEVDTAHIFANGETERMLGKIVVPGKARVSSKIVSFGGQGNNLSPSSIAAQLGETLAALKVDSLDILYLQGTDPTTPIEKTLEACDALHRKGKFKELGMSQFAAWQVVNAYHICASRGWVRPTVYQGMYNALTRDVEGELLPALRSLGIRFYAINPLAGGVLTSHFADEARSKVKVGRYPDAAEQGALLNKQKYFKPSYLEAVAGLSIACKHFGLSVQDASLRWLAHHSGLRTTRDDGIVLGASKVTQLRENIQSVRRTGPLPLPLVVAFEEAWDECRVDCPPYFVR